MLIYLLLLDLTLFAMAFKFCYVGKLPVRKMTLVFFVFLLIAHAAAVIDLLQEL